ncbi:MULTISPECIES: hypothetical protein [Culturomica]|uniref:hypothetical protein n=1 Tax=Culturomica TaxID=1926651 RepID=UPI00083905D5|nr:MULTISPECIES: hypothetical protein [Culturomica]HBO25794.1 hypothetical protein [Culturomica sp.]
MKKYLTGILFGLFFLFGLCEITGYGNQINSLEDFVSVQESGTGVNAVTACADGREFDVFYLYLGEIPATIVVTSRGGNFFRTLRFQSTIRVLSAIDIPLVEKNSKGEYFHFSFGRTSYRYFVYTLRRLLI